MKLIYTGNNSSVAITGQAALSERLAALEERAKSAQTEELPAIQAEVADTKLLMVIEERMVDKGAEICSAQFDVDEAQANLRAVEEAFSELSRQRHAILETYRPNCRHCGAKKPGPGLIDTGHDMAECPTCTGKDLEECERFPYS
jgi:hypothetical protein